MQPLTNAVPLPASFPIQQATHDPPVPDLLRRESPPTPKMGFLDSPEATEGQDHWGHALVRGYDSVHGILVRVEGDRPHRLVRLGRLPSDDQDDFAWDNGERTQGPR